MRSGQRVTIKGKQYRLSMKCGQHPKSAIKANAFGCSWWVPVKHKRKKKR